MSEPDQSVPPTESPYDHDPADVSDAQLASLEASNRVLSENVRGLTDTLRVVSELQQSQREQSAKQAATDQQLTLQRREAKRRERRVRQLLGGLSIGFCLLLSAASIVVYLVLLDHVNNLLDQVKTAQHQTCTMRNKTAADGAVREQRLAAAEDNPDLKAVHTRSAQQLRGSFQDCDQVKS